jgi:hypothetical protein
MVGRASGEREALCERNGVGEGRVEGMGDRLSPRGEDALRLATSVLSRLLSNSSDPGLIGRFKDDVGEARLRVDDPDPRWEGGGRLPLDTVGERVGALIGSVLGAEASGAR